MTNETSLISLFTKDPLAIIELRDSSRRVVGAVYTATIKPEKLVIQTNSLGPEKYFLYYDGVGIYFSYYQKLEK